MQTSAQGADFIRRAETLRLTAYLDTVAEPHVWTIGYGQTGHGIVEGLVWTIEQAQQEFRAALGARDLQLSALLKYPASQDQFDAMASLAWNIGLGRFSGSTLLLHFNGGDLGAAAREFTRWCHANNLVVPGLLTRRTAELVAFLGQGFPES